MDLDEFPPGEEQALVFAQGPGDLHVPPVFQVEAEVLVVHLHHDDGGKGQTDDAGGAVEGEQRFLFLESAEELVQHGEEAVRRRGLEEIGKGLHRIALHGKLRGGGEENDLGIPGEGADLPGGLHPREAGHEDIQQHGVIGRVPQRFQQLHPAVEEIAAERGLAAGLVLSQQRGHPGELLPVVVADGDMDHDAAPFPDTVVLLLLGCLRPSDAFIIPENPARFNEKSTFQGEKMTFHEKIPPFSRTLLC